MTEFLADHWILSIVITILLGAIGSGLWDIALKPVSRTVGGKLYAFITFGAKRSRDKVYRGAAMGHHELPSLYILLIVLSIGVAALFASQIRLYASVYALDILPSQLIENCVHENKNNIIDCKREMFKEKILPAAQLLSLGAIFMGVFILYQFAAVNRMNLVTTYYEQCMRAVRPFLEQEEFNEIERQYALMKTKENYDVIIAKLALVAEANGSALPETYL